MARLTWQEKADGIIAGIIERNKKPFEAFGKQWGGQIFYSAIWDYVKISSSISKVRANIYQRVCEGLRENNFYIYS